MPVLFSMKEKVNVNCYDSENLTFHSSCSTSASILPGTLVAKILAISKRVTAISGVAWQIYTKENMSARPYGHR